MDRLWVALLDGTQDARHFTHAGEDTRCGGDCARRERGQLAKMKGWLTGCLIRHKPLMYKQLATSRSEQPAGLSPQACLRVDNCWPVSVQVAVQNAHPPRLLPLGCPLQPC